MTNKEICENCIYNEPLFEEDCNKCKDNSNYISYKEFNEDMDMYHEPPEEVKPEISKKRYFLIGWLINLILRYENNYSCVEFSGIVKKPAGKNIHYCGPKYLTWYFKRIWINEMYNGGYTGDIYGGEMFLKLFPGMYLAFLYDM